MLPLTLGSRVLLGQALPRTLAYVTSDETGALSRRVALPDSFIYIPPRLVPPEASRVKTVMMMTTSITLSRMKGHYSSCRSTTELLQYMATNLLLGRVLLRTTATVPFPRRTQLVTLMRQVTSLVVPAVET